MREGVIILSILFIMKDHVSIIYNELKDTILKDAKGESISISVPETGSKGGVVICEFTDRDSKSHKIVVKYTDDSDIDSIDLQTTINSIDITLAPKILYRCDEFYVEEFIEGTECTADNVSDDIVLKGVKNSVDTLSSLHITDARTFVDVFDEMYQRVKVNLTETSIYLISVNFPEEEEKIRDILLHAFDNLEGFNRTLHKIFEIQDTLTICHNDIHQENIIITGDSVRLIDFEFCAINNPKYDLVNFYEETYISTEDHIELSDLISGIPEDEYIKLALCNSIFWSVWGIDKLIQTNKREFAYYLSMRLSRLQHLLDRFRELPEPEPRN